MAISRFDARKGLIVEESNDLGALRLRWHFVRPASRADDAMKQLALDRRTGY
jgi:hypothetical protein